MSYTYINHMPPYIIDIYVYIMKNIFNLYVYKTKKAIVNILRSYLSIK